MVEEEKLTFTKPQREENVSISEKQKRIVWTSCQLFAKYLLTYSSIFFWRRTNQNQMLFLNPCAEEVGDFSIPDPTAIFGPVKEKTTCEFWMPERRFQRGETKRNERSLA